MKIPWPDSIIYNHHQLLTYSPPTVSSRQIRFYRSSLADEYDAYCDHYHHPWGLASKYILYGLLSTIMSLGMGLILTVVGLWDPPGTHWSANSLVHLLLFLKSFILVFVLMRKSAVTSFLGGSVLTSNLIMWKRNLFTKLSARRKTPRLVHWSLWICSPICSWSRKGISSIISALEGKLERSSSSSSTLYIPRISHDCAIWLFPHGITGTKVSAYTSDKLTLKPNPSIPFVATDPGAARSQ